jgi:hypothetical protein
LGFGLKIDQKLRRLNLISHNDTVMTFVNNGKHSLPQVSDVSTIDANKGGIHNRPEPALNRL